MGQPPELRRIQVKAPGITYNPDTDGWEGLPETTTVTDHYTFLVLDNGLRILSFGGRRKAGEDVHILDKDNETIHSWFHNEWEAEGEAVMGAILRTAGGQS